MVFFTQKTSSSLRGMLIKTKKYSIFNRKTEIGRCPDCKTLENRSKTNKKQRNWQQNNTLQETLVVKTVNPKIYNEKGEKLM